MADVRAAMLDDRLAAVVAAAPGASELARSVEDRCRIETLA
jgi:hypothetical protein